MVWVAECILCSGMIRFHLYANLGGMKILIAYTSNAGSTAEAAETIGETWKLFGKLR